MAHSWSRGGRAPRREIAAFVIASVVLSLVGTPAVAADGGLDGPSSYSFPGQGDSGPSVEAFGGTCTILAEIRKYSSTELGAHGFQDCEGGFITNQTLEVWIDRCTFEFPSGSHNCITWGQSVFLRRCSVAEGGPFWCPPTGAFIRVGGLGPGQYKARVMGTVTSNIGDGSGSDESGSIFLP